MTLIPTDKILHFLVGAGISLLIATLFSSPLLGFFISALAGILKEIYDKLSCKGTPDLKDALATSFGALISFLL